MTGDATKVFEGKINFEDLKMFNKEKKESYKFGLSSKFF